MQQDSREAFVRAGTDVVPTDEIDRACSRLDSRPSSDIASVRDQAEPVLSPETAVLIPARNEPRMYETLESVARQSMTPQVVVVVLNNCTDDGATRRLVARAAEDFDHLTFVVLEMESNPDRKAGALNFGLEYLSGHCPDVKWIAQMDADSLLDASFLQETVSAMRRSKEGRIAALSCIFTGRTDLGGSRWERLCMWYQRVEYATYHDATVAKNVNVVSGTGCLLSMGALEQLREKRGQVWLGESLVEDFELTLALRELGWETRKSHRFRVYTDLMPDFRSLVQQRTRWQRGTFEELRRYGWTKITWTEHARQVLHGLGMLVSIVGWSLLVVAVSAGLFGFHPLFFALLAILGVRRAFHARGLGWRTTIIVATLIPEQIYGMIRNYWWLKSLFLTYSSRQRSWA